MLHAEEKKVTTAKKTNNLRAFSAAAPAGRTESPLVKFLIGQYLHIYISHLL